MEISLLFALFRIGIERRKRNMCVCRAIDAILWDYGAIGYICDGGAMECELVIWKPSNVRISNVLFGDSVVVSVDAVPVQCSMRLVRARVRVCA